MLIYEVSSPIHDPEAVRNAHAELLQTLTASMPIEFRDISLLVDEKEIILLVATGGVEQFVKEALDGKKLKKVFLIADGLQNSLAASFEISAWLRSRGIEGRVIHDSIPNMADQIASLAIADCMRGARVGVIGNPSDWLIASNIDYDAVAAEFGIEFIQIPLKEVEDEFNSPDLKPEAGRLDSYPTVEPNRKDIEMAVRLARAVGNVAKRYELDAFTLKCFDLLDSLHTTGCLALSWLNAEGIPAGCEGDLPALLSMLMADRLTGQRAFMANPSGIDTENNEIILAHCTLPFDMGSDIVLRSHFESGIGVAIQAAIPLGAATVLKWWGPKMQFGFVSDAEIVENLSNPSLCRTQIRLKLKEPVEYFLNRPLGNHHVVVCGAYAPLISRFFRACGCTQV